MKDKDEFEITILDNDQKSKIRAGSDGCECGHPTSSAPDEVVDDFCDGDAVVDDD